MQYCETFHQKPGSYASVVVARPELTARWHWDANSFSLNYHAPDEDDYTVADERDVSVYKTGNKQLAAFSIERAVDSVYGEVAASTILPGETVFANNARWFALIARATGAAALETCYVAAFQGQTSDNTARVRVYSVIGGVYTALFTSAAKAWDFTKVTLCKLQVNGSPSQVKAKFWEMGTVEPTAWDIDQADGSVGSAGWWGVGVVNPDAAMVSPYVDGVGFLSVGSNGDEAYIPVTREERRRYLEQSGSVAIVACKVGVLGAESPFFLTPVDSTLCIATRGFVTKGGDDPPNTVFKGVIKTVGSFSQRMNEVLQGRATQGFGTITLRNNNGDLDDWLRYNWDGRPCEVLVGAGTWRLCDFMFCARGTTERIEAVSWNDLAFRLRDGSNLLARRIQETTIASGPNEGRPIPITLGQAFNASPVLIDEVTSEYQYHDGPTTLLFDVRESGDSVIGSVVPDNPTGTFAFTASPAGQITCDPRVALGSPGDYSHLGIFTEVLVNRSALENDQLAVTIPGTTGLPQNDTAGMYIGPEYRNTDTVLEEVVISAGGFGAWNRWGEYYGARLLLDPDDLTALFELVADNLTLRKLKPKRIILPGSARQLKYKKNYTVQDPGSIVGIVGEADRNLFSTDASIYTALVSGPFNLDDPTEHLLARQIDPLPTLNYDSASAATNFNEYGKWKRTVAVFEFETRKRALEMELGHCINLTHSRYGFDAGAKGVIVGIEKNYRSRTALVEWAVQLTALWPATTADYPFVP